MLLLYCRLFSGPLIPLDYLKVPMASFLKSKYALACLNTHTHKHKYTHKHIHTNTHEKAVFISSYLLVCLHP